MPAVSLTPARLLVSLAILSALVGSTAPSPLYGIYQASLNFSSTTLTSLFAMYAMGVLLALAMLGKLSDGLDDRRFIIVPALAVVAVGSLVFAFSTQLSGLFIGRFLAGIGTGALTGSANAALVGFDGKDCKAQAAVYATVSFTLGAALGPVLSAAAIYFELHPTITPFVLNAFLATLTAAGMCLVSWELDGGLPTTADGAQLSKPRLKHQMAGNWKAFAQICCILVIAWTVGSVFVALGPSMVLATLSTASATGHASAGLLVTAFQATAGITQYLFRHVVPERAMKVGGALLSASWLGCVAALYLHHPPAFVMFSIVAGIGYGSTFVGAMGLFTSLAPSAHRATLGSLFYLAGYLGSALGIIAMGAAVDLLGINCSAALMSLVLVASLGALLWGRVERA